MLWLRRGLDAVVLASPRPCLYHDWQELLRYDNEAKVLMTTWTMKNTHIESHILTRSRLVSMAVSVGRLTTRANICGYEDRAAWQARLRDAEVRRQPARLTL